MQEAETPKHIGPMAQDVIRRFPDKVFAGPDGYLRIRLTDLPTGVTAFDLCQPVLPAGYPAALARWQRVFNHWREKT
jgi:hypothetical protein